MATLVLLGAVMVAGGFAQILHAVSMPSRRRALAWGAAGVFYLLAGCLVFFAPRAAATLLTMMLAILIIASGVVRLGLGLSRRSAGRGWMLLSGLISVVTGLVIAGGWPANARWVLGVVLAVDLLVQGFTLIGIGAALRTATAA
jgi:uncharacterized membrane protein HdeD (DUF308 family)